MQAFNPGDRVFLIGGEEAVYVAAAGNRHVVRLVFEGAGADGGPAFGEPQVVNGVYARAPTVKLDAEIVGLTTRRDALHLELAAITRDLASARAEEESRKARMQQHAAIDRVLDFMEGRFAYFVVESYVGFQIVERGKALEDEFERTRWGGDMKLLTLFGTRGGGLEWRLNKYRDGSGSDTTVVPCQSIEEAREVARAGFLTRWKAAKYISSESLKLARACGIEPPEDVLQRFRAEREASVREHVQRLETELAKARAELAADLG